MKLDRRIVIIVVVLVALLILGVGVLNAQRVERVFTNGDQDEMQQTVSPQDKPAITTDQAQATVLAANPGATVTNVQLEKENGVLQYSVKLNNGKEVLVNAANGQIINSNQNERDQEGDDGGGD